ncbi:MAG: glycosyltransferase family A protein [Pyrinomonadaceae bacterium]
MPRVPEIQAQEAAQRDALAPAVSVIIPTYNAAAYIAEALDSVLAQTFTDYETIVVNDGSPDTVELERVLEPYLDRIFYIKQENRGVSGARNTGIRAARAPLVAHLDPDDQWEPEYLAAQVAEMRRDPSIDLLYPNALIFGDMPEAGREFMELCPSEGEVTFESLVTQRCNVMTSVTARREMMMRAGLFDESLRCSEDFDLWLRIVKEGGRIAYHRRVLVRYRRRRGSLSSDPVTVCENALRVLEKCERNLALSDAEGEALKQSRARVHAMLRFHEGKRAFTCGDTKAAIAGLKEANAFFLSRKTSLVLVLMRLMPRLLLRVYGLRDRYIWRADTSF